ncbi:MAG: membrane dipeptidase [Gemmatimonadaceae bacterium]|nr:membrane dipeptidase [Acetobacteraceae bacterium]
MPDGVYASPETLAFHRDAIVFDCLSLQYLLDPRYSARAMEGGVTATNLTVATENETWDEVVATIESSHDAIARSADLMLATTAADIRAAKRAGKIAIVLGTQGSEALNKAIYRVGVLHRLGVRYIGLAYTGATMLGDGCGERRDAGLSVLGEEFIEAVNALPMILDLSHSGHRTRTEAVALAKSPVCTHSNAYAVNANDRNTKDPVAQAIAAKGGVMGVCGLVRSVAPTDATIEHMLDHTEHYVRLLGAQHVGLGLDFTEAYQDAYRAGEATRKPHKWRVLRPDIFGTTEDFFLQDYPRGLQSIRLLPNFTQGLFDRGFSEVDTAEILGGAWLRHFEAVVG